MTSYRFTQVDVFASGPLLGNPVAVVHDAEGLGDAEMAAFARWTNLSETTFLLPPRDPSADYRLRIWTPGGELPFAGHPTLGSAHAWIEAGGQPRRPGRLVQECGAGLVTLRLDEDARAGDIAAGRQRASLDGGARTGGQIAFAAPPLLRSGEPEPGTLATVAKVLRIDPAQIVRASWVDNGPGFLAVQLPSAERVLALEPDFAAMRDAGLNLGVIGAHPEGHDAAIEVRGFVPGVGVPEDPVTGSLNAGIAQWLISAEVLPGEYVAAQGTAIGRAGRVHVRTDGDGVIWVGGATRTRIRGVLDLN